MFTDIVIREENKTDKNQIKDILDKSFGKNRFDRTVYLYRKIQPIRELSLVSYLYNDPSTVIGTINFYPVLVNEIQHLLLGPLAVKPNYQGKGFGKSLIKKSLEIARSKGQMICFVSGEYIYYKEFGFNKIKDKNLNLKMLGQLTYKDLLVCELHKGALNLLPKYSKILPIK